MVELPCLVYFKWYHSVISFCKCNLLSMKSCFVLLTSAITIFMFFFHLFLLKSLQSLVLIWLLTVFSKAICCTHKTYIFMENHLFAHFSLIVAIVIQYLCSLFYSFLYFGKRVCIYQLGIELTMFP